MLANIHVAQPPAACLPTVFFQLFCDLQDVVDLLQSWPHMQTTPSAVYRAAKSRYLCQPS